MRGEISHALKAYNACHDEEEISRLLIVNARQNPAHGHYFELRHYYLSLSEDTIMQSAVLIQEPREKRPRVNFSIWISVCLTGEVYSWQIS